MPSKGFPKKGGKVKPESKKSKVQEWATSKSAGLHQKSKVGSGRKSPQHAGPSRMSPRKAGPSHRLPNTLPVGSKTSPAVKVSSAPYQSTPKRATSLVKPTRIAPTYEKPTHAGAPHQKRADTSYAKKPSPKSRSLSLNSPEQRSLNKLALKSTPKNKQKANASSKITRGSHSASTATTPVRSTPSSSPRAHVSSEGVYSNTRASARQRQSYSHSLRRSIYTPARDARSLRASSLNTSPADSTRRDKRTTPSPIVDKCTRSPLKRIDTNGYSKTSPASKPSHSRKRSSTASSPVATLVTAAVTPGNRTRDITLLHTPFREQTANTTCRIAPDTRRKSVEQFSKEQHQEWDTQAKEWLHKSWKVCFLSAMASFDVNTPNLCNGYQRTLRNKISDSVPFNMKVLLQPLHCFSRTPTVTDAVSLTVSYSIPRDWEKSGKKSDKKLLYRAMLLKDSLRDREGEAAGVALYPIMFYVGRNSIHHAVVNWLQESFGCYVSLRSLSSCALLWAAGLWYRQPCKGVKEKLVSLHYHLQGLTANGWQQHRYSYTGGRDRDNNSLQLEMSAAEIRKIVNCIVSEDTAADVTVGERDLLQAVLHQMLENITGLPQCAFRLHHVSTACVALSSAGQVRVVCRRHLRGLLQWLLKLHRDQSLLDQINTYESSRDLSQDLGDSEDGLEE